MNLWWWEMAPDRHFSLCSGLMLASGWSTWCLALLLLLPPSVSPPNRSPVQVLRLDSSRSLLLGLWRSTHATMAIGPRMCESPNSQLPALRPICLRRPSLVVHVSFYSPAASKFAIRGREIHSGVNTPPVYLHLTKPSHLLYTKVLMEPTQGLLFSE